MKVVFAGGGTGGHLFPGIEVAQEMARRTGAECIFCGTGRIAESRALDGTGFAREILPAEPWGGLKSLPRFVFRAWRAFRAAARRVREIDPDIVVGLGGYASAAPVAAAARLGKPVFLLEQNAVPGRANRLLARFADAVFVPWDEAARAFPRRANVEAIGNPVRRSVLEDVAGARETFGLDPDLPTLLVMGGSQGARGLNRAILEGAKAFAERPMQVIHLAGDADAGEAARRYAEIGVRAAVLVYLDRMALAYSAADVVLARAGGTSIAELACRGLPAVLVPFPAAAEDHQTANARAIARSGGAVVVPEGELGSRGIAEALVILFDAERRNQMAGAMRRAGRPEAAREIVDRMLASTID